MNPYIELVKKWLADNHYANQLNKDQGE